MKTLTHNFSNGLSVQRRANGYFYTSDLEGNFSQEFAPGGAAVSMTDEQFNNSVAEYLKGLNDGN